MRNGAVEIMIDVLGARRLFCRFIVTPNTMPEPCPGPFFCEHSIHLVT